MGNLLKDCASLRLASGGASPYSEGDGSISWPRRRKRSSNELAAESRRGTNELLQDALAGYLDELAQAREMLNSRYDDLKSGRAKPIDDEEAFARLKAKTEAQRNRSA